MRFADRLERAERRCPPLGALAAGPYAYEDKPPFDVAGFVELCAEFAREDPADRVLREQEQARAQRVSCRRPPADSLVR